LAGSASTFRRRRHLPAQAPPAGRRCGRWRPTPALDQVQQPVTVEHPAGVDHEGEPEVELAGGQRHLAPIRAPHPALARLDRPALEPEHLADRAELRRVLLRLLGRPVTV
jgi:hypothetical protein